MTVLRAALLQQQGRVVALLGTAAGIAIVAAGLGVQANSYAHQAQALLRTPHPNLQQTLTAEALSRNFALDGFAAWLLALLYPLAVLLAMTLFVTGDLRNRRLLFAWTQGVQRSKWVTSQFAVLVSSGVLGTLLIMPALLFAMGPVRGTSLFPTFDSVGLAAPAYAAFAGALALVVGLRIPSLIAAPIAMGAYLAARYVDATVLRPNYLPPRTAQVPMNSNSAIGGIGWTLHTYCGIGSQLIETSGSCLNADFIRVIYQPENRFWLFQSIEAALFALGTLGLVALSLFLAARVDLSPA